MFFVSLELEKYILTTVVPTWKLLLATTCKNPLLPPLPEKNPSHARDSRPH